MSNLLLLDNHLASFAGDTEWFSGSSCTEGDYLDMDPLPDEQILFFPPDTTIWATLQVSEPLNPEMELGSPMMPPRRLSGNNPYGSRGCASCITCRRRKGKVCTPKRSQY